MDEFVETVGAIRVGGVAGVVVAGLVAPALGVVHGRRCVIVSKEARRRVLLVRTGAVFANTPVRL